MANSLETLGNQGFTTLWIMWITSCKKQPDNYGNRAKSCFFGEEWDKPINVKKNYVNKKIHMKTCEKKHRFMWIMWIIKVQVNVLPHLQYLRPPWLSTGRRSYIFLIKNFQFHQKCGNDKQEFPYLQSASGYHRN